MHFTIEKEIFLKGLAKIQGIVEKRNTIPILSNVLIEATEGGIGLTATDLEVGMRATYPAEVKSPGMITVSAKKIFEIIKELPEAEITFRAKENSWVEIRCGKALFNIVGLSSEEYPFFPNPSEGSFFSINCPDLKEMIEKTSFAMSTDESKYNLNGIYFRTIEKDNVSYLRLVATDGHRLSLIQKEMTGLNMEELREGGIFPRKGVFELRKMADEGNGTIALGFLDNNAVVKKDTTLVLMRMVDGDFPDYGRVIPKNNELSAKISRDQFLHGLRRMAILSSEKSKGVRLSLKPGIMEMFSSNPDFGDAREDVELDYAGPELSIGFNARYILDVLQTQTVETIELLLKDNLSPGIIRPLNDGNYLAVVMPMRL
jgi:DNA polymerase III subunit beta